MSRPARGFTLLEIMIAMALGLIVIAGIITVFSALRRVYGTALAQAAVQNANNAISAVISPAIRGAGFGGCGTLRSATVSTINTPGPLTDEFGTAVTGYDAIDTPGTAAGTGANTFVIPVANAANDATAADWTPALDVALPSPEKGSDVLVISGTLPGSAPAAVNDIQQGANSFTVTDDAVSAVVTTLTGEGLPAPAAISDCGKSIVFMVTAVAGSGAAVNIEHAASGIGTNITAAFQPNFAPGAQFVPLQQSAFYVAQGPGGQSALYKATVIKGQWVGQALVPGVENMQVFYGVTQGGTYEWLPAGAVGDWGVVSAVRIGFLVEGGMGSNRLASQATFNVLGTTVTVPADTRLRHVFEMTVYLRNVSI